MTNVTTHVPAQHSAFNGAITALFSVAILALAGVLTFAVFVNV